VTVPVPNVPGKERFASVYRADDFVAHLRAGGWDPGPLPTGVIFTYGGFEQLLAGQPGDYTMNPMLGPGPGRFFHVNATGGRVAVCCLGIGAPAAVAQMEVLAALGVRRFLSIGTAGGLGPDQSPGDLIVLTDAVRDEGVSYHYLGPDEPVAPDAALTAAFGRALLDAGQAPAAGSTWSTDAPYRQSAEEIAEYRGRGVLAVEMEAAALFAVGAVRDIHVASAVVLDGVYGEPIDAPRMDTALAFGKLYDLFRVAVDCLAGYG
jgi:uridine phosphorylase